MGDGIEAGGNDDPGDNFQKIAVGSLTAGMFVAELDRPWLGTPFLIQGFEIHDDHDIELLREYCRHVYVLKQGKPEKRLGPLVHGIGNAILTASGHRAAADMPQLPPLRAVKPGLKKARSDALALDHTQRPLRLEHQRAREVLDVGRINIEKLLHSARLGQMLDMELAGETVEACVKSIMRDPEALLWMTKIKNQSKYTAEHCLNVCILALAFGRHLGKTEAELQLLGLCGLLHDVGKMHIPPEILDKPGPLSEDEFAVMKQHTVIGKKLLEDQLDQSHHLAIEVAHSHHEQPDGRGYPRGLAQGEIVEFAQIISLVDVYDAITSNRCYSRERHCSEAQQIIFANRGSQFDGELALSFIQAIGPYPPGTLVELHNGMSGIVLASKPKYRHLPTVLVLRDRGGKPMDECTLDLSQTDIGGLGREFLIKRTLVDGAHGLSVNDHRVSPEPRYLLD
jgi:putative nucleotidyltransferase with HDIG domain